MEKDLRAQFLKVYASLPLGVRKEIICVLDDWGSISWFVAYLEVKENTEVSLKILETLRRLEII